MRPPRVGRDPQGSADIMTEFQIQRLGHHGDGIADGPVFAARTLPGETVSGQLNGDRLEDVKILVPSDHRVKPACPHYRACGGCDLQHASDGFVAEWKQGFVQTALADRGLTPEFRPMAISPAQTRRRATLAARRTKSGALAGFHARRSDVLTAVPNCQVLDPQITGFLPVAEQLAMAGASRKSALSVAVTASAAGPDVAVQGGKPLDGPLLIELSALAQTHDIARLTWDGETVLTRAAPVQEFDGLGVTPPPGAFLQATRSGQQALIAGVVEAVGPATRIADLFAGCGTFALPLSRGAAVHAVEGEQDLLTALDQGWRRAQGLRQVTTERRDLFRNPLTAEDLAGYDAVVIDPPRAGAVAQTGALAQSDVPRIAYVSCNPVTFARDAETLVQAGYVLDWVQVVDQFRWSMHTELVSSFTRPKS